MKVSHHQIELPLFCILKMVKYRHFITKLASSSTQMNVFLRVYDPNKHIRRHLMGVDRVDFPLAQPEKPSATSGRILQWFHTACGVGKKVKVKNQLIHGIFELFMARCWERYWKNTITNKNEQNEVIFQTFLRNFNTPGGSFSVIISNVFGAGRYYLVVWNLDPQRFVTKALFSFPATSLSIALPK